MIKIKIKTIFIGLIFLISLVPFVMADTKLDITSLKAYVDGDKDSGTLDANPESEIKIKFDIDNIYDKTTGLNINDITVTSVIKRIDDGEDLDPEEDPDVDDLRPGEDDSAELVFQIPLEVEDDTYDLEIKVEGKDTNNTLHTVTELMSVKVDKETHDVKIRSAELYNPTLKCSRSTQLSVSVINMGTSDEDNVALTVTNEDLGLSKRGTFDLNNDPFDSDSRYSTSYPITATAEQEAGTYPINVKISYYNGAKITEKNVDLTVEACEKKAATVVQQPATTTTVPPVTPPVTGEVVIAGEQGIMSSLQSVIGNKGIFALILLVELAVIVIGVVLVVSWVKRK